MRPAPIEYAPARAEQRVVAPPAGPPLTAAQVWRRALAGAALGGVLAAVVVSDTAHAGLSWLLGAAEPTIASRPVLGGLAFVLLSALSAMVAFFSTALLVPVALDAWGPLLTGALLWTGWTIGAAGAYALGRYLGRPVVRRLASADVLARYERWVSARAPFGLVVLFLLALQSEVPGYALGMARYSPARYLLAAALVEVPFTLLTLIIGAGLVQRRLGLLVGAGAAILLLSGGAFLAFRRRSSSRTEEVR